jgi:hypothetical protein
MLLTVRLDGKDHNDRAAFPDEIDVGPPEVLRVAVEASVDPADPEQVVVRRYFPDAARGADESSSYGRGQVRSRSPPPHTSSGSR